MDSQNLFEDTQDPDYVPENDSEVEKQPSSKKKRTRAITYEWTDIEILKLISSVELKELLWKPNHEHYKNRNAKDAAWREIEEAFGGKVKTGDLTTKWNSLRVQYKQYAAKYKSKPSGSGREATNKWKFFDAMNFIGVSDDTLTETTVSNLQMVKYPIY